MQWRLRLGAVDCRRERRCHTLAPFSAENNKPKPEPNRTRAAPFTSTKASPQPAVARPPPITSFFLHTTIHPFFSPDPKTSLSFFFGRRRRENLKFILSSSCRQRFGGFFSVPHSRSRERYSAGVSERCRPGGDGVV